MTPHARYAVPVVAVLSLIATANEAVAGRGTLVTVEPSSCAELRDWARQYERQQPTLDELVRFDLARRRAIMDAVSADARAAAWREQFHRFATNATLTDRQRAYVARAAALAIPDNYRGWSVAHESPFVQLWTEAAAEFISPEQRAPWFVIGIVTPSGRVAAEYLADLTRGVGCNCRETDDCFIGQTCGNAACTKQLACGPAGSLWCDGRCQ